MWQLDIGASYEGQGKTRFKVWAPRQPEIRLKLLKSSGTEVLPMRRDDAGYFSVQATRVTPGDQYVYVLSDGSERPDPASRYQPEGIHGPSEVVDANAFKWQDQKWNGISIGDLILYELHVGTFTSEGTLEAVISKVPYLKKLGINVIELMPLAQFSGRRNWGYDGVDLFAVQNSYGGPEGLKKLVNACHAEGLAVCLDVVYNHLGPEGNYLHDYGPYFTNRHRTPWGDAVNYEGKEARAVREYFISNALFWVSEYHIDVLRLDAVHGIFDSSKPHILKELNERVQAEANALNRAVVLIAESNLNDPVLVRSREEGGYAYDAQWSDDFHHAVHVVLTGEQRGYYRDYSNLEDIAKAIKSGFIYDGKYSSFRQTEYGQPTEGVAGERFVIALQNHDQVGNRAYGDRLSTQISFAAQKTAATLLLTAPATPLLFMGEEYGETAPFQYFVDHSSPGLTKAVWEGRKAECAVFGWTNAPNPKDVAPFKDSKLNWNLLHSKRHKFLFDLYQDLIRLRRSIPELSQLNRKDLRVYVNEQKRWLVVEYPFGVPGAGLGIILSFLKEPNQIEIPFQKCTEFEVLLDSESKKYGGSGGDLPQTHCKTISLQPEHAIVGKIL